MPWPVFPGVFFSGDKTPEVEPFVCLRWLFNGFYHSESPFNKPPLGKCVFSKHLKANSSLFLRLGKKTRVGRKKQNWGVGCFDFFCVFVFVLNEKLDAF